MPEPLSTVVLALAVCVLLAALAWAGAATRAATAGALPPTAALGAPLVETARLVRQRRRRTVSADLLLWRTASLGLLPTALLMLGMVPLGEEALLPLGLSVVWLNALDVVVWALVWLLGWGANSVRGLVGGYRFLALALGYELPLMFALVAPAIAARSLDLAVIGAAQDGLWFGVWMPVAFATYLLGVLGFALRGPLASPVGADAGGGVLTELSGPDRLLALAGRHALLGAGAAAAVPLFLGGGAGPVLPGAAWVVLKALALTVALSWVAARTPVLAPHRLLAPAWLVLLPLVVAQDLVVAVVAVLTTGGAVSGVVDVAFWALGVVSVLAGAAVFRVDSMARATYALALSFVAVGACLLLLGQAYLGAVVVLMMVMEMAVMAVYMVMFMGMNPALMPMSMVHSQRWALVAGASAFLLLGAGAVLVPWPQRRGAPDVEVTRALGEAVMGPQMLVMMAISPVMVATIVAGVVLSVRGGRYDLRGDDLDQDPGGETVTLQAVLLVAAALLAVGLYGALSQQVVVMVMMGLELMVNGVVLALGGLWWFLAPDPSGQVLLLVVVAAMTVEMATGFAVATLLHRQDGHDMTDMAAELHE